MLLLHAVAAALGECHSDISDSGSLNEEERGLWIELAQLLQAMPTLTTFLQPPATLEWAFAASQSPLVPHVKAGDRVMITPQRLVRPSWLEPQAWPGWHLTRHLRSFTTLLPMMRDAEEREGGSEASSAGSEAVLETPLRLCARARRTLGTSALEPCRPKVEEESADSLRGPTEPESRPGSG